jgi:hypothetical protein
MQQREAPPELHAVNPDVDPALSAVVDRALAIAPEGRFADMEELRDALHDGARGIPFEGTAATQLAPAGAADETEATRAVSAAAPARRLQPIPPREPRGPLPSPAQERAARREVEPPRRQANWGRWLIIALILALIVTAIVIAALGSQPQDMVQLREIDGGDVSEIVEQVEQLVDDNTE